VFLTGGLAHTLEHPLRERRVQQRLPSPDRFHCPDQVVAADLLEHVAARPGSDGVEQHLVLGVRGKHDHLGFGCLFDDLSAGVNAASSQQPNVHHHDVGMEQQRLLHGLLGRGSLIHDHEIGLTVEECAQTQPHHFVIVHNQDLEYHTTSHVSL